MPVEKQNEVLDEYGAGQAPSTAERGAYRVYNPKVDIIDAPEAIILVADVPGADESETDVTLEDNLLTIKASVVPPAYEGYVSSHREYGIGDFQRVFRVSDDIDQERVEATVKDGVLRVRLPKAQRAAARKISVKTA